MSLANETLSKNSYLKKLSNSCICGLETFASYFCEDFQGSELLRAA